MPPVVIPGTVRAVIVWNFLGVPYAVNVHHYLNFAVAPVNQALANLWDATYKAQWVAANMNQLSAPEVSLASVSARDLNTANQPEFVGTGAAVSGIGTEDPLPLSVTLVATLRTSLAGRAFRGRHYQPGWDEANNNTNGQATITAQTALLNFLNNVNTDMQNEGFALAVATTRSFISPGVPRPPQANAVVGIDIRDGVWDTQRRRSVPGI